MERKVINRKHFSFWSLKNWTFSVLSPLACFQCADTLLFAAKHAKGMSLRYGVIIIFDSIHDSATMYYHCPRNFPLSLYVGGEFLATNLHKFSQIDFCGVGR